MSDAIQTADLDWQCINGIDIPICKQCGDIFSSIANGLHPIQHVFIQGHNLSTRLAKLYDFEYFCVGATHFGTGLNVLALWQLWQQVRPDNHSHLHIISVEKFPLKKADLIRVLAMWPELQVLAQQLIQAYPLPIAGCHRLDFPEQRFSIDLWLGDANEIFPVIAKTKTVDAWFLDQFFPACNLQLWQEHILNHIVRLSDYGTTFTASSVEDVLKQGLSQHGITISCPVAFNNQDLMLKAIWSFPESKQQDRIKTTTQASIQLNTVETFRQRQIAIIGAGIAGLSCAYAFAQRGHKVTIYDQSAPLAGASGNPLALLNPRLGRIEQSGKHLVTLAWLYAMPYYQKFQAFKPIHVNQLQLKEDDDLMTLTANYPSGIFTEGVNQTQIESNLKTQYSSVTLLSAATLSPQQLSDQILQHPLIQFQQADILELKSETNVQVMDIHQQCLGEFDHVIVCAALNSQKISTQLPKLTPNRGQVSWVDNSQQPLDSNQAYSYGGYCMQLNAHQLLLGASFVPDQNDHAVLVEDHVHNYTLIHNVFPEYAQSLAPIDTWQGRASVRTQSPDYFPLLGKIQPDAEIYTFTALGSKGFLFAPLCSAVLVAQVLGEACPLTSYWVNKLDPRRFIKKVKPKKPYYQKPS